MPVDLEADLNHSDNDIFIFIIKIHATRVQQNKLFFFNCVWIVPALLLQQRKICEMSLWIIYLTSAHPKLSKRYMFIVLFLVVYLLRFILNGQKLCLQKLRSGQNC